MITIMKYTNLGDLFDKAGDKYCDSEGCYLGTCPVNCLVFLVSRHLKHGLFFMLYGDYQLLKRLGK